MNIFNSIFSLILIYGYPAIGLTAFLTSAGVPLPGVAIALAAGSLAASGNHNLGILFVLITLCNLAGDILDFFLGKVIGERLLDRIVRHSSLIRNLLSWLRRYFTRWSEISIFLTRWLVPMLAPTVSLLAGITEYPLPKFIFFAFLGEAVSSIIFLSLGYLFSVNWLIIANYLNHQTGIGVGIAIGVIFIVIGISRSKLVTRNGGPRLGKAWLLGLQGKDQKPRRRRSRR